MKRVFVLDTTKIVILVCFFAGFLGIGQVNAQKTIYVDVLTGNDGFNGSNWTVGLFPVGPLGTIRSALKRAESGDFIVISAGDYVAEGVINPDNKDLTFLARTSRGNKYVLIEGITADDVERTLILDRERKESGAAFVTNGDANDLTLLAGTLEITGSLIIGKGGIINRNEGKLTGNAPQEME